MSEQKKNQATINEIDNLLPQTQCGLCDYAGCLPYAEAIVNAGESIDRCLPGGTTTLKKLGALLHQDPTPYLSQMEQKAKPAMLAVIREDECIGCTKCIQACPVDAIIGASKQMHTIISDACTGCELCIPPCPVDCIDMIAIEAKDDNEKQNMANQSRARFQERQHRLERDKMEHQQKHQLAKLDHSNVPTRQARQAAIAEALNRVRAKKLND